MDQTMMLLLVSLAIPMVEGIKVIYSSLTKQELNEGVKVIAGVLVGATLAAVAEFAPDAWVRVMPILMVALAVPGLYSIGKRSGNAVFNNK